LRAQVEQRTATAAFLVCGREVVVGQICLEDSQNCQGFDFPNSQRIALNFLLCAIL